MSPHRVSFLVTLLLTATASHAADVQRVTIACKGDEPSFRGTVSVTCNLVNKLGEPVLIPATSFAAEGPQGKHYIYKYLFGERYQHVFQYDRAANGTLEKPIQFEPVVHLSSEVIRDLRWLPPNGSAVIRIEWKPPSVLRRGTRWSVRVKMIYARRSHFANAGERVRGECRALAAAPLQKEAALPASAWIVSDRPFEYPSYRYDDCHDVISEAFEHVVSPEFGVVLTRN